MMTLNISGLTVIPSGRTTRAYITEGKEISNEPPLFLTASAKKMPLVDHLIIEQLDEGCQSHSPYLLTFIKSASDHARECVTICRSPFRISPLKARLSCSLTATLDIETKWPCFSKQLSCPAF